MTNCVQNLGHFLGPLGTRVGLFEYFRQVLMHFIFNSWKHLIEYIIKNLKLGDDLLLVNSS